MYCIHIYIHACLRAYTHTYVYAYIHISTLHVCFQICTYVFIPVCPYVGRVCTRICACVRTCVFVFMYSHTGTYIIYTLTCGYTRKYIHVFRYTYAWFGNRRAAARHSGAHVKSRAAADGECARFLHRLTSLQSKHTELATFYMLLDSCEVDEVAYYMHARRVLVGLNGSKQMRIEVAMPLAVKACKALIMRHAHDAHADNVRTDLTRTLLSSKSTQTASGGVDSGALLASLLAVYKEEKLQVRAMLEVLHTAGASLSDYPAIHKLRAMLQSVDPTVTDHAVLDIYLRCSIVDHSRNTAPATAASRAGSGLSCIDSLQEHPRVVVFGMLWVVVQRHGFMVNRQRIGMEVYVCERKRGASRARSSCSRALPLTHIARARVRALMHTHTHSTSRKCCRSQRQCRSARATRLCRGSPSNPTSEPWSERQKSPISSASAFGRSTPVN